MFLFLINSLYLEDFKTLYKFSELFCNKHSEGDSPSPIICFKIKYHVGPSFLHNFPMWSYSPTWTLFVSKDLFFEISFFFLIKNLATFIFLFPCSNCSCQTMDLGRRRRMSLERKRIQNISFKDNRTYLYDMHLFNSSISDNPLSKVLFLLVYYLTNTVVSLGKPSTFVKILIRYPAVIWAFRRLIQNLVCMYTVRHS